MTTIATELAINRDNTARYIALKPTEIFLIPGQDTWKAGSKRMVDQPDRGSQFFYVIWGGSTGITPIIEGTTMRFDFILVGTYDAIVAINDHWQIDHQMNVIKYVFPHNGYEVKCGGDSYGSVPVA